MQIVDFIIGIYQGLLHGTEMKIDIWCFFFNKNLSRNSTMWDPLHEHPCRSHCYRLHKFAIKTFFTQHSVLLHLCQWRITQQYTQKALSSILCNYGYANVPHSLVPFLTLCYSQNADQWFFNTITLSNQK